MKLEKSRDVRLLQLENIVNDIPLKLKHETLTEEKEITNNFYSDYSSFKRALFEDLIENNPDIDKLLLFKKTHFFYFTWPGF